jgi:hypothetical protein
MFTIDSGDRFLKNDAEQSNESPSGSPSMWQSRLSLL